MGAQFGKAKWLMLVALFCAVAGGSFAETLQYSYDTMQRLTRVQHADGTTIDYVYDNLGNPLVKLGTFEQPMRFSTEPYDETTGLVRYPYRFYAPSLGRWLSRDPIDVSGGLNLYAFVGNNPLNFVDPMGLDIWVINRELGGNEARSFLNPLSHTFLARTDESGVGLVTHTYSWGNEYDADKNGLWVPNAADDMKAAEEAIRSGNAKWLGDSAYDDPLRRAFDEMRDSDDSRHRWWYWNNCKHEARDLWERAKKMVK